MYPVDEAKMILEFSPGVILDNIDDIKEKTDFLQKTMNVSGKDIARHQVFNCELEFIKTRLSIP